MKTLRRAARSTLLVLVLLGPVGCAHLGPTRYQPMATTGGFRDSKVQDDLFHVEFRGNGYTSPGTVRNYFLFRCAELTVENGYQYFQIVDGNFLNSQGGVGLDGTFALFSRPEIEGVVQMFEAMPPGEANLRFDARQVLKNLMEDIERGL